MMGDLRITLLGKFGVRRGKKPVKDLEATKTQELLAYLLLYRERPHHREKLAALLWEDSSPSQSKGYLRQTLWQLQSALGEESSLLLLESDWIQIAETADLQLDVARFEQAYAQGQGIQGRDLDEVQATALQEGVALYRSDLLENWYQEWCLFERERLQNTYLAMLEKLIGYCETHQRYDAGTAFATRLLRCDLAHERTYRRLMRLHYLAGNRTRALRTYRRCVAALDGELGVPPSHRTVALHEQIQADHLPSAMAEPADAPTLPTTLECLLRLQRTLLRAQEEVAKEIEAVRSALRHR